MSLIPGPEIVQRSHRVVIGVDTHKYVHVAVALDEFGRRLDAQRFAADRAGYTQLIEWAAGLGRKLTFASTAPAPTVPGWPLRSAAGTSA